MKLFRVLLCVTVVVATLITGCTKPTTNDLPKQDIAVTYYTIDGAWQLTEWQGVELTQGTELYIAFNRKEQSFEMWDNLRSMYMIKTTGKFMIEQNEYGKYILSGWYDYGVGDWANDYIVQMPQSADAMLWHNTSTDETMKFKRIESLPEFNN